MVYYFWCLEVSCILFVVFCSLFLFLICALLCYLVVSCGILWCLVVSCVFFAVFCGFMLFLICVSCCILFVECCGFLLFLICGVFFVVSTCFLICNVFLCLCILYFKNSALKMCNFPPFSLFLRTGNSNLYEHFRVQHAYVTIKIKEVMSN